MQHALLAAALLAALTLPPRAADAQRRARAAVSVDATVGAGTTLGGTDYQNRGHPAVDLLVGLRLRGGAPRAPMVALAATAHDGGGGDLVCRPSRDGGCRPLTPGFFSLGALAGLGGGAGSGPAWRVLAGPAVYRTTSEETALGVQGRVDAAAPAAARVALVGSLRGAVLPSYRGDALGIVAFGVGVRLQ